MSIRCEDTRMQLVCRMGVQKEETSLPLFSRSLSIFIYTNFFFKIMHIGFKWILVLRDLKHCNIFFLFSLKWGPGNKRSFAEGITHWKSSGCAQPLSWHFSQFLSTQLELVCFTVGGELQRDLGLQNRKTLVGKAKWNLLKLLLPSNLSNKAMFLSLVNTKNLFYR